MYDYMVIRVLTSSLTRLLVIWSLAIISLLNGNPVYLDSDSDISGDDTNVNEPASANLNTNANHPISESEETIRERQIQERINRWSAENSERDIRHARERSLENELIREERMQREVLYQERLRALDGEQLEVILQERGKIEQERKEADLLDARNREQNEARRRESIERAIDRTPFGATPLEGNHSNAGLRADLTTPNTDSSRSTSFFSRTDRILFRADGQFENNIFNHFSNNRRRD